MHVIGHEPVTRGLVFLGQKPGAIQNLGRCEDLRVPGGRGAIAVIVSGARLSVPAHQPGSGIGDPLLGGEASAFLRIDPTPLERIL